MKCTNSNIKKQLACYQFGLLDDDEKVQLEAHLFDCDDCLEDFYHLVPLVYLLEAMPERFIPALQPQPSAVARLRRTGKNMVVTIKRFWSGLSFAPPQSLADWTSLRLLAAVMATVLIITLIWLMPKKNYSDLAIIEKASYRPLQLRGPVQDIEPHHLFDKAMEYYQADNYAAAIDELSEYIIQAPTDPRGFFYLGISLLITGSASQSVSYLITAAKIAQQQGERSLHEQCLWYLSNAYLKLNRKNAALTVLQEIIDSRGSLTLAAEAQIIKIQKR